MSNTHSVTLVINANSTEALIGICRESLDDLESSFANGDLENSTTFRGSSEYGDIQGVYTGPNGLAELEEEEEVSSDSEDFDSEAHEDFDSEVDEDLPEELKSIIRVMQKLGAQVSVFEEN